MPKRKLDPLPSAAFQILLALADEDRHGYGIMRQVAEQTGGRMRLGPGTLYSSIQGLLEAELIKEVGMREDAKLGNERQERKLGNERQETKLGNERQERKPGNERQEAKLGQERRRYYRLTSAGRKVACSEAERLAGILRVARAKNLLRGDYV
ncbi:MAG TPA: helix-turn-helix transcriptional regulator [Bryobacteraceae bacterium]|nr:helix-turn-helix transcriptional regulator [Bryobacteraceae bacterium]